MNRSKSDIDLNEQNPNVIKKVRNCDKLWSNRGKKVRLFFFEKKNIEVNDTSQAIYCFWEYGVKDEEDYNSIYLVKSAQYLLKN